MLEANKQSGQAPSNHDHTVWRKGWFFFYGDPSLLEEHMNLLLITQSLFAVRMHNINSNTMKEQTESNKLASEWERFVNAS